MYVYAMSNVPGTVRYSYWYSEACEGKSHEYSTRTTSSTRTIPVRARYFDFPVRYVFLVRKDLRNRFIFTRLLRIIKYGNIRYRNVYGKELKFLYGIVSSYFVSRVSLLVSRIRYLILVIRYYNPSGGTLPSNEGQLPNCSLRLSVEDRR